MPAWGWVLIGVGLLIVLALVADGRSRKARVSRFGEAELALRTGQRDRGLELLGDTLFDAFNFQEPLRPPDVQRLLELLTLVERVIGWRPARDHTWRAWRERLEAIRETGGTVPKECSLSPFIAHLCHEPLLAVCEGAADEELVALMLHLLEGGADPNQCDTVGNTPLLAVAARGHLLAARLLVERGADINHRGWTYSPLSLAEDNGCAEVAEYLAGLGAERWDAEVLDSEPGPS